MAANGRAIAEAGPPARTVPGLRPFDEIHTVGDVVAEQGRLVARFAGTDHGLYWFTRFYRAVTEGVWREVTERDPRESGAEATPRGRSFLARLDVNFYRYYRDALSCDPPPPAWQPLLARRGRRDIHPMVFGLSGVIAHITCDLPQAINDTIGRVPAGQGQRRRPFPAREGVEQRAYTEINDILYRVGRGCLGQDFATGLPGLVHLAFPAAVDHLVDGFIRTSRTMAWDTARQLHAGAIERSALEHEAYYCSELLFSSCKFGPRLDLAAAGRLLVQAAEACAKQVARRLAALPGKSVT